MMEIVFQLRPWLILITMIAYIAIVFTVDRCRKKREAARFEQHQKDIRYFNWLYKIGLLETRIHFNIIGQNHLLNPQWDN